MNGKYLAIAAILALGASTGCATKKYVRQETAPVIDRVNELDELTAKNSREIKDVDTRAQQGIQSVTTKAAEADQKRDRVRAGRGVLDRGPDAGDVRLLVDEMMRDAHGVEDRLDDAHAVAL